MRKELRAGAGTSGYKNICVADHYNCQHLLLSLYSMNITHVALFLDLMDDFILPFNLKVLDGDFNMSKRSFHAKNGAFYLFNRFFDVF